MMNEREMKLIAIAHGTRWYLADDGFEKPGIYFVDGQQMIHVMDEIARLKKLLICPPAPTQPPVS